MQSKRFLCIVYAASLIGIIVLSAGYGFAAAKENVLYTFKGKQDGHGPASSLVFDGSGNLYGTTQTGGKLPPCDGGGCGVVFKLTPGSAGWTESVLYTFKGARDGAGPSAGLVFDKNGALYGTTSAGGDLPCNGGVGGGVVFRLAPSQSGWAYTVLHAFHGGVDGSQPFAGLIVGADGNLYGTTTSGGPHGGGTVFELTPTDNGRWKEKILYAFAAGADGGSPFGAVVFDGMGNIFGTTLSGGDLNCSSGGCGTIFELVHDSQGWHEKVLHTFTGGDGMLPGAGLTLDGAGHLYGTTTAGGTRGNGTVFKLTSTASGWRVRVLHNFGESGNDGGGVGAGVVVDRAGNLYGTTLYAGRQHGGTAFKLQPSNDGHWNFAVLYAFGRKARGGGVSTTMTLDSLGNLYGAAQGGAKEAGLVFQITP
jgi:uncharacterized repeat protein (TIGR03803 family)